jgi:predicted AAA+ superfamily ATPase
VFIPYVYSMKRLFWDTLTEWSNASTRKPLLLQGARQVGKTWILKAFGEAHFERLVLLDFAEDPSLCGLFKPDLKPSRILTDLSVYLGRDIDLENTFLIFDEIQLCPEALTSLKYFYEAFPSAHICASGSLLGLGLSEQNFPVGKVQREWLRPLCFFEFLEALGEALLCEALRKAAANHTQIAQPIHNKTFGLFKEYLITGGMPEVVHRYIDLRDTRAAAFKMVRSLQRELTESYLDDVAKHSGSLKAVRIAALFKNIPEQLARETRGVRKFLFKDVIPGRSTYDALEGPVEWLIKAGLVHRVPICRTVKHPLAAYTEKNTFMLYLFDTGILGSMLHLDPVAIYQYDFGQFKGFLAENAVLNELLCAGNGPVYTWRGNSSEIEFLLSQGNQVVPIEVKAGLNTKAKSMRVFREKHNPEVAVLFSAVGANQFDNGLLHAPLYLSGTTTLQLLASSESR